MHRIKVFATTAALANYAAVLWHLYLEMQLRPTTPMAEVMKIAAIAGGLTFLGLGLLWIRWQKIGSVVLAAMFANGLVLGCLEHFFVASPVNVFYIGDGDWTALFKVSVAILVVFQLAGLSATGRILVTRSAA